MTKVRFSLEPTDLLRRCLRECLSAELLELSELDPRLSLYRCMAAALTAAALRASILLLRLLRPVPVLLRPVPVLLRLQVPVLRL